MIHGITVLLLMLGKAGLNSWGETVGAVDNRNRSKDLNLSKCGVRAMRCDHSHLSKELYPEVLREAENSKYLPCYPVLHYHQSHKA